MSHIAQLCDYNNPWNRCNNKYCAFDVPPYLPRRPQSTANMGQNPSVNSPVVQPPPRDTNQSSLVYYGVNPGPVCAVDTDRLPSVLHEVLGVSKALAAMVAASIKDCKVADTVWLNARSRVSACGFDTITYNASSVLDAAGMKPPTLQYSVAGRNSTASAQASTKSLMPNAANARTTVGAMNGHKQVARVDSSSSSSKQQ